MDSATPLKRRTRSGARTSSRRAASTVAGTFIQTHATFFDTVDIIAALRYDSYEISGAAADLEGSRVSPKITVGYTAVRGVTLFGTYAEGYRAPAITETLVFGLHPAPASFTFLPNPNLRPEVAHNLEAGINLKFDGILQKGDAFRGRVVVYRNKVDDYIDGVSLPDPAPFGSFQYQNIANATLEGVEIEGMYDARAWFFGLAATRIRGTNDATGLGLLTVPADRVTLTAGFRALDHRLIAGARMHFIDAQDRLPPPPPGPPPAVVPSDGYTLVDLFAQYEVNQWTVVNLNIDNLFDRNYRQFLDQSNSPGFSARLGLTMRFGVTPAAVAP
jgi:hemoglobin/transferrin/lactoferrin receptor protein